MRLDPLAMQLVRARALSDHEFRAAMERRLGELRHDEKEQKPVDKPVEIQAAPASTDRDWLFVSTRKKLSEIATEVCKKHEVSMDCLKGNRRNRPEVRARQEFCWRARRETNKSLPQIGMFINRDHSTVVYAVKKHAEIAGTWK